jgi:hypothetical protein
MKNDKKINKINKIVEQKIQKSGIDWLNLYQSIKQLELKAKYIFWKLLFVSSNRTTILLY